MKLSFDIEILKNCFHKLQSSTYDNVVRISNTNTGRSCTHRCVYVKISAHIGVRKFKHADSLIHWRSGQKLVKNSNKKKRKRDFESSSFGQFFNVPNYTCNNASVNMSEWKQLYI